jgi:inner membrane protein
MLFSAIVFLLIYDINLSPVLVLTLVLATWLGSSTPDLDTPTGGLWQKVPAGSFLGKIIHPVFLGGHRHLSHSLIGMGIFVWLFWMLLMWLGLYSPMPDMHTLLFAFILGYSSHLFADLFTEAGVPLLFPIDYHFGIPPDPFGKVRIKTGKWFENLIVYPVVNIALLLVILCYFKVI